MAVPLAALPYARAATDELKAKLASRTAHVAVIGLGYVGLPLVLLFNEQSFPVTGFDVDQKKVDRLARGECYLQHIVPEQRKAAVRQGFKASWDFSLLAEADLPAEAGQEIARQLPESIVQQHFSLCTGRSFKLGRTSGSEPDYPGSSPGLPASSLC